MSDMPLEAETTTQDARIRQRAYEIWESEGRDGDPEDHWLRAEREFAGAGQNGLDAATDDAPLADEPGTTPTV